MNDKTVMVQQGYDNGSLRNDAPDNDGTEDALLFVFLKDNISEFRLSGVQHIGRPTAVNTPEIIVPDNHVSRRHGCFETANGLTRYYAEQTSNGVYYKGKLLEADDEIVLRDGDELRIPIDTESDVVLIFAESDERKRMWRSLARVSRDELTGLPNRKSYTAWFNRNSLNHYLDESCLFILDIDRFKGVNDNFGHEAGDRAIQLVADSLKEYLADDQHAGRWGGDEFVGVVKGSTQIALKTLQAMSDRVSGVRIDDSFNITISIGIIDISEIPAHERNIHHLIELADEALYEAKAGGRNCIHVCEMR